jgi:hypothetical protein
LAPCLPEEIQKKKDKYQEKEEANVTECGNMRTVLYTDTVSRVKTFFNLEELLHPIFPFFW